MKDLDHSALSERYRSLTDDELLRLLDRRADLLPIAQLALDQEAGRRRTWLEPLRSARSADKTADNLRYKPHVGKSITCPKCDCEMKEGFVLDSTYGSMLVSRWISGKPEDSFWTGLKVDGREQHFVQTFRCIACGYLESYANESGSSDA